MCGICGYCSFDLPQDPAALHRATSVLAHRGPDGRRTWMSPDGAAGLGHTRLAIIDLETGDQPMGVGGGRWTGVFNGEIYNFRELRQELESLGQAFRTHSDTEVLLQAYCQWGTECLLRLDGMFAFAIYDRVKGAMFLARDRTGIKPLYYHIGPAGLFFASELKALLAWPQVPRRRNYHALADCLVLGYPLLPATCFRDCIELEPGCSLEFSALGVRHARYWAWKPIAEPGNASPLLAVAEEQLKLAVREQTVADVPLGAFLSGGIDSSLLVALLAGSTARPLQTFTARFGEAAYDESGFARAVARHVGSEHHELEIVPPADGLAVAGRVLDQFDQPFGDSSAVPTYLLSAAIRQYVKVVIGGDGGDEMFGGYERFFYADVARMLGKAPDFLLAGAGWALDQARFLPATPRRQMKRLLTAAQLDGGDRLSALCSQLPFRELCSVATPDFRRALNGYRPQLLPTNGHRHIGGAEMIDATVRATLPSDYLRKIDMMSSAHGLEVRVPMLSNRVLNLSARLPREWKYSGFHNKVLLRKLAESRLPQAVARRKKHGFGLPLDSWLGNSGRRALRDTLQDPSSSLTELIQPGYIENLLRSFCQGKWDRSQLSRYGIYQRVYSLWSLERWLKRWHPAA